jgi:outer membrane protein assembly factor BamB
LIVPNEQEGKSQLLALDAATGKERWKVARKSRSAWSTPCVYQPKDGPAQLIFTSYEHGISGHDPRTGKSKWEADLFSRAHIESPIASPISAGDLVLGTCGWLGVKKEIVVVRPGADGKAVELHRLVKGAPLVPTPLVKDDLLFAWADEGVVTCADLRTGKVHWRERVDGSYYSSPVCVAGRLYGVSRDGDVVVLAAAKKFELLARNTLGEGSHSTPAVAGGTMYLRTFSRLMSLGGTPAQGSNR